MTVTLMFPTKSILTGAKTVEPSLSRKKKIIYVNVLHYFTLDLLIQKDWGVGRNVSASHISLCVAKFYVPKRQISNQWAHSLQACGGGSQRHAKLVKTWTENVTYLLLLQCLEFFTFFLYQSTAWIWLPYVACNRPLSDAYWQLIRSLKL